MAACTVTVHIRKDNGFAVDKDRPCGRNAMRGSIYCRQCHNRKKIAARE